MTQLRPCDCLIPPFSFYSRQVSKNIESEKGEFSRGTNKYTYTVRSGSGAVESPEPTAHDNANGITKVQIFGDVFIIKKCINDNYTGAEFRV
jgi:hypothetical protein